MYIQKELQACSEYYLTIAINMICRVRTIKMSLTKCLEKGVEVNYSSMPKRAIFTMDKPCLVAEGKKLWNYLINASHCKAFRSGLL
jgi:hypothetical protein